jgi:energy-coupling factor transporter transmembrane protein EcfT
VAELTVFGYRHGRSCIHRLDVRFKLASLLLLTAAVTLARPAAMAPLSLGLLLSWGLLRLPLRLLGGELAAFALFLLVVFAVRAAVTPGEPLMQWAGLAITREGLQAGAVVAWRLALILALGLLFVTTTRPAHLKAAVQWLLGPVPFVPARRAATMVGLVVRFIPVLHQQIGETRSALAARSGNQRSLSLRRLRFLVLPTLRRVLLAADQLALAMAARGYQERRTDPDLRAGSGDGLALAAAAAVFVLTLVV